MDDNSTANVSEATNATNGSGLASSGILVATKEGIIVAYSALIILAILPIVIGSIRSLSFLQKARISKKAGEQVDIISTKDAMMFPVFASCALLGLYIVFKALGEEYVNWLLNIYIFIFSSLALARALEIVLGRVLSLVVPHRTFFFALLEMSEKKQKVLRNSVLQLARSDRITDSSPGDDSDPPAEVKEEAEFQDPFLSEASFTFVDVICVVLSFAFGGWYLFEKHWFANNILALSFAVNGIEMISLNKVFNGCILLGGLFFYDVFWVFGTDVMVTVAKSFNAPIKLVFPMDILQHGWFAKNFALLGLGDIVIPGIFIALLLRYDRSRVAGGYLYFVASLVAYFSGLMATIFIMHYFKHAQPALLYLVPACLGVPMFLALVRGEVSSLLSYQDHEDSETASSSTDPKAKKTD